MTKTFPELDSKYLIAFNLTHETLKSGLNNNSKLNPAEYRLLLQIAAAKDSGLMQSDLSQLLLLPANVISQSLKTLENLQLIARQALKDSDQRKKQVFITEEGKRTIEFIDTYMVKDLYEHYPTYSEENKRILENAIFAGAAINSELSKSFESRFSSSLALSAFELYRKHLADQLKKDCKCNLHEARVIQKLSEVDEPIRLSELSEELIMSPVNIGRTVDSLTKKDYVIRLQSEHDKKAIYVALSDEGEFLSDLVQNSVNTIAEEYLFKKLSVKQCEAILDAGKVILQSLIDKRRSEQLMSLRPLK